MKLKRELENLECAIPVKWDERLGPAVHWTASQELPVHRWFRYREGFSPKLLTYFTTPKRILDPFCGCGTTLVESSQRGIQSFGIDLNPLATFVTSAKTCAYSKADQKLFSQHAHFCATEYKHASCATRPMFPLLDKLFMPESLEVLLRLKNLISQVHNKRVRHLLFLAWLDILEAASNVFKEGNGLKYRNKRRRPGQYETIPDDIWIPSYFGLDISHFVRNLWTAKCEEIATDLSCGLYEPKVVPKIRTGSCLDPECLRFDSDVDMVLFSPPYANRFDYFEAFKMELWMGDFVQNGADMRALRSKSMRNNLAASHRDDRRDYAEWDLLAPFLCLMDDEASSVRMGIKPALQGYFADMRTLLRELRTSLSRKAHVVIVVGNSAYAGTIIPTDILLAHLAREEHYRVEQVRIARHLHVSSQQRPRLRSLQEYMRESVIILSR